MAKIFRPMANQHKTLIQFAYHNGRLVPTFREQAEGEIETDEETYVIFPFSGFVFTRILRVTEESMGIEHNKSDSEIGLSENDAEGCR